MALVNKREGEWKKKERKTEPYTKHTRTHLTTGLGSSAVSELVNEWMGSKKRQIKEAAKVCGGGGGRRRARSEKMAENECVCVIVSS